jgi:hypothetical protein
LAKLTARSIRKIAGAGSPSETAEQDHRDIPSFRIDGKIFATLWDPTHLNVMLSPVRIVEVAGENPEICREIWWGHRLSYVQLELTVTDRPLVEKLIQ